MKVEILPSNKATFSLGSATNSSGKTLHHSQYLSFSLQNGKIRAALTGEAVSRCLMSLVQLLDQTVHHVDSISYRDRPADIKKPYTHPMRNMPNCLLSPRNSTYCLMDPSTGSFSSAPLTYLSLPPYIF